MKPLEKRVIQSKIKNLNHEIFTKLTILSCYHSKALKTFIQSGLCE